LRIRKQFREAVAAMAESLHDAHARLNNLDEPARACIAEGLNEVTEKITAATRSWGTLEDLERECKFPDKYREQAAAFVELVGSAEATLKAAEEVLAQRAAERAERNACLARLDNISQAGKRCADIPPSREEDEDVKRFAKLIREGLESVPRLRADATNSILAEWKAQIEALEQEVEESVKGLNDSIEKANVEAKRRFSELRQKFGN